SVNDAIVSVTSQERLIKQIHFPKIVLPIAAAGAAVANFAFGLIALGLLLVAFYASRAAPTLLLIPFIAVVQFTFTLALALVVAAINVFYRDVGNVSRHVLRLWFYLSPALYSTAQIQACGVQPDRRPRDVTQSVRRVVRVIPFGDLRGRSP